MKNTVKNLSDTKVEVSVVLDAEELAIAEQVAAKKLSKDIKIAGFRKGKTPIAVAIKAIDPSVLQEETLNNAVSKSVSEIFVGSDIQALDRPMVEVKKFVPGEILEYTATVEVMPKVKLGNYKKLKVKIDKQSVPEAEVDEVIDRILKGFAIKQSVDRAVRNGDEAVIDFVGKKDDVEFDGGKGNDYPLEIGSNQFIPGFEEGVIGHKKGDKFDLNLEFPENYGAKDLAGKAVVFSVEVKDVKEITLPEKNDELAKKAGPFKTFADLEADIKRELMSQKEREAEEKLKEDLINQLVEVSSVPVPEILVNDQMKSLERDFNQNLAYQGLTVDQYIESRGFKDKDDWMSSELKETAVKRVKSGLALAELSKLEKVEASTKELEDKVNLYKQQYANNPEALGYFEKPEVLRDVANRLLTEKTVELLVTLNRK